MARPKKKGLTYFPHDVDASSDEKIEWMRILYGNDGYAFYFILLERIYRTGEAVKLSNTVQKTIIAAKCGVDPKQFDRMVQSALDCGLFDRTCYEKEQALLSPGIQQRLAEVDKLRAGWRQQKQNTAVFSPENSQKTQQRKEKENKTKEMNHKISTMQPEDYLLYAYQGLIKGKEAKEPDDSKD